MDVTLALWNTPHPAWSHPFLRIGPRRSQAGWYVGQTCPDTGEPLNRLSEEYYPGKDDCLCAILHNTWTRRMNP